MTMRALAFRRLMSDERHTARVAGELGSGLGEGERVTVTASWRCRTYDALRLGISKRGGNKKRKKERKDEDVGFTVPGPRVPGTKKGVTVLTLLEGRSGRRRLGWHVPVAVFRRRYIRDIHME